ncbi:MAG: TolC family protein [Elusimicrobiota bacterium]|nr:MAG: TolC family protein [Elusimicrobiota bacterium]
MSRARGRADVESARAEKNAAEDSIKVVTRRRWPSISADANYYLKRPPSFTQDVKWDATITGSLPLWAGGEISAQSRQAKARAKAQDAALSQAVRTAELETRSAYQDLTASYSVVAALDAAEKLAEQNAKAQSDDYRLGQVTNLDVLGGLNVLQQTRLALNAARVDSYWSRVRLEVAAGVPGGSL